MLLLPEEQLPDCSKAIRAEATGTSLDAEIDDVIAAILVSRFSGRTVPEICAMGGITAYDFTSSVAYREIFGLGQQDGEQKAAKPKLPRSPSASCSAVAARSSPTIRPSSRAYPSAISKTLPMPCSISRSRQTSRSG
jgi:hypothetical protein